VGGGADGARWAGVMVDKVQGVWGELWSGQWAAPGGKAVKGISFSRLLIGGLGT